MLEEYTVERMASKKDRPFGLENGEWALIGVLFGILTVSRYALEHFFNIQESVLGLGVILVCSLCCFLISRYKRDKSDGLLIDPVRHKFFEKGAWVRDRDFLINEK